MCCSGMYSLRGDAHVVRCMASQSCRGSAAARSSLGPHRRRNERWRVRVESGAQHTLTDRNADTPTSKTALAKSRVPATMSELTASSLVAQLIQQARSLKAVQEAASVCPWVVLTALAGRANRTIKSPMRHDPVPPACWIVFVSHAHHVTPGWRAALFDPFPQDPIRSSNVIRILPPLILGVPTVVIDSVHVGARCVSLPHLTRRFTAQPLPLAAPLPSLLLPKFPKCVPPRLEPGPATVFLRSC